MDTGLLLVIGIALGLGFDLYAKAVCQGALLSRIDKAKLALGLLVCGVYQLIVLLVGYVLTIWLRGSYLADKGEALNPLISMIIFVVFAIKMLKNAWKNEGIVESRHDGKYLIRIFISLCLQVGFYTLLTGIALGMMQLRSICLHHSSITWSDWRISFRIQPENRCLCHRWQHPDHCRCSDRIFISLIIFRSFQGLQ